MRFYELKDIYVMRTKVPIQRNVHIYHFRPWVAPEKNCKSTANYRTIYMDKQKNEHAVDFPQMCPLWTCPNAKATHWSPLLCRDILKKQRTGKASRRIVCRKMYRYERSRRTLAHLLRLCGGHNMQCSIKYSKTQDAAVFSGADHTVFLSEDTHSGLVLHSQII